MRVIVGVEDFLRHLVHSFQTSLLFEIAKVNNLFSYECFNMFKTKPKAVHPVAGRSLFDIKRSLGAEYPGGIKQVVFESVSPLIDYNWEKDKNGNLRSTNYDITDSFIVAHGAYKLHLTDQLLNNSDKKQEFETWYFHKKNVEKEKEKLLAKEGGKKKVKVYEKEVTKGAEKYYQKKATTFISEYYSKRILKLHLPSKGGSNK